MATLLVLQNLKIEMRLLAKFRMHKALFNLKEGLGMCSVVELTCVICKLEPSPIMTSLRPSYFE